MKEPLKHCAKAPSKPAGVCYPLAELQTSTPANSSRRRAAAKVDAVLRTPPRSSYASKIAYLFDAAKGASSCISDDTPRAVENDHCDSKMMCEADVEKSCSMSEPSTSEGTTELSTDSTPSSSRLILHGPSTEVSSSDSWTGDEEFIPRSVRRRNLIRQRYKQRQEYERKLQQSHKLSSGAVLTMKQINIAAQHRETRALLGMHPVSPPKALKLRGPEWEKYQRKCIPSLSILCAEKALSVPPPPSERGEELCNTRSSDGDDEAESDDPDL